VRVPHVIRIGSRQRALRQRRRRRWVAGRALLAALALLTAIPTLAAAQPVSDPSPAGYLPGNRTALGLGLSPYSPQVPALPGGLTIAPGAPGANDDWVFNVWGFISAALRVSQGARDVAYQGQSIATLHTAPRVVDSYGSFMGTNSPQGSWVDLTFEYGNSVVTSHVKITTWKPDGATDWTAVGSQNFVDEAYLTYKFSPAHKLQVQWTAGAFRDIYGGLAQYSVGNYNAQIVGMPFGVGEKLAAQYALDDTTSLFLEDGFMGRLGKAPAGVVPTADNGGANPALPSSWVHHIHAGVSRKGDVPFVVGLHFITNWAQDERDQIDDPRTYGIDEAQRPDPTMNVVGFDVRVMDSWLGNFALSGSYADAKYATLLTGLNFFGAYTGEQITKRFLGAADGGTGTMEVGGLEYTLGWARFLRPKTYQAEAPNLITSVFVDAAHINSMDPTTDGKFMSKFGAQVTYRFFPWLALSARADHVAPNSKDVHETFNVINPAIIFKSNWLTHEQVTLAYTQWFYGADTHADFPDLYTRGQLDDRMYSLTFGMWF
jgi:hypothetical protein